MTRNERDMLTYLERYISEHGLAPTYEEIRVYMGWASKSGAHRLIETMVAKGLLARTPRENRSLRLIKQEVAGLESVSTDALMAELKRRVGARAV